MLVLDHVFFMVLPDGDWAARLGADLPPYDGPRVHSAPGSHGLEVVVGAGHPVAVTDILAIDT